MLKLEADHASAVPDALNRDGLASDIAQLLQHPVGESSIVIAIDGPWGSGKSWLLDQIASRLNQDSAELSCHPLHFNPWLIGEESDLIQEFLVQVALELDASAKNSAQLRRVTKSFLEYAQVLSYGRHLKHVPVPFVNTAGELIDKAWEAIKGTVESKKKELESEKRPTLSKARLAAKQAMQSLDQHRLIVFIDDLDRLRAKELRAMMQLVKAVADFPRTSFVMALDSQQVARALADGGTEQEGQRYLEKIIQLRIPVPDAEPELLKQSIRQRFDAAVAASGHTLAAFEAEGLDEALNAVAHLCTTPRAQLRWSNQFAWALLKLKYSVNAADLAIIEALRLRVSPAAWAAMGGLLEPDMTGDIDAPALKLLDADKAAIALLRTAWQGHEMEDAVQHLARSHGRIASPLIWAHYLRFGAGGQQLDGARLRAWLAAPLQFHQALGNQSPTLREPDIALLEQLALLASPATLSSDPLAMQPLLEALLRGDRAGQVATAALDDALHTLWHASLLTLGEAIAISPTCAEMSLSRYISCHIALESETSSPTQAEAALRALARLKRPGLQTAIANGSVMHLDDPIDACMVFGRSGNAGEAARMLEPLLHGEPRLSRWVELLLKDRGERLREFLFVLEAPRLFWARLLRADRQRRPDLRRLTPRHRIERREWWGSLSLRQDFERGRLPSKAGEAIELP